MRLVVRLVMRLVVKLSGEHECTFFSSTYFKLKILMTSTAYWVVCFYGCFYERFPVCADRQINPFETV